MLANGQLISTVTELLCIKTNCHYLGNRVDLTTGKAAPTCTRAKLVLWQLQDELCPVLNRKII